ncbi:hypothetical protein PBRA_004916 [Plasmodiophora brassicae]|uniref:Uncharacterized protein n=1 Tax=Plasmodiophora brassicae TaxID=37360 RepID=A0A0G4IMB8_PLABS|nr:hypothetical protein PBRA_004916 [Plasmodiophora brassicae]
MGNVVSWISSFWQLELEMAILGLQNAGKSSLVSLIAGNDADDVIVPTVGYHFERIVKGNVTLKVVVWDLGGSPRFREMWPRYVRGAHVVVFVVDSANAGEMSIAKQELHAIMSHPRMKHIPVLVMANKSDLPHASAPERVGEQL